MRWRRKPCDLASNGMKRNHKRASVQGSLQERETISPEREMGRPGLKLKERPKHGGQEKIHVNNLQGTGKKTKWAAG